MRLQELKTNSVYLNTMYEVLTPFLHEQATQETFLKIRQKLLEYYPPFFAREIESGLLNDFSKGELNVPVRQSRLSPDDKLRDIHWHLMRYGVGHCDMNRLVNSMFEFGTGCVLKSGATVNQLGVHYTGELEIESIYYDTNFSM